jgi:hypothetical protein
MPEVRTASTCRSQKGMTILRRPTVRSIAILLLAPVGACSLECTLIGCDTGLAVVVEDPPAFPYRVEVFPPVTGPRYVMNCTSPSVCFEGRVFFGEFLPRSVTVEVIGSSGTRRHEVLNLEYENLYPNGRACGSACRQATIHVPDDA